MREKERERARGVCVHFTFSSICVTHHCSLYAQYRYFHVFLVSSERERKRAREKERERESYARRKEKEREGCVYILDLHLSVSLITPHSTHNIEDLF